MKTFLKDKQGTKRAWPILSGPGHQRGGKRRFSQWICIFNLIRYNIQSMQTGTLEALKLDPVTILSPCPLHPLQNTWLQWWGILQIHWEEKKSKKKLKYPIYPGQPVGSQSINSFFTLLFITLIKIHFFLYTPKKFWTTKDRKTKQKRQYTALQGLAGDYRPFLSSSKTFSHFGQNFSGSAEVEQDGTSRASLWSGKYQKLNQ